MLVKFGQIAVAQNVVIFNTQCVSKAQKKSSANGRVRDDELGFGSCSHRLRIVKNTSNVFGQFLLDFGVQFCMAGAIFGDVGLMFHM